MRRSPILLAAALVAACTPESPPPAASPQAGRVISDRALVIGQHIRAALACGQVVPGAAQDRAAAIESAALAHQQGLGGEAARDAWLQAVDPPAMTPRRQANWCIAQRPDIDRIIRWLEAPEGAAFAMRAAEVQAR